MVNAPHREFSNSLKIHRLADLKLKELKSASAEVCAVRVRLSYFQLGWKIGDCCLAVALLQLTSVSLYVLRCERVRWGVHLHPGTVRELEQAPRHQGGLREYATPRRSTRYQGGLQDTKEVYRTPRRSTRHQGGLHDTKEVYATPRRSTRH